MTPTAALSNPRVVLASAGMLVAFALIALGSSPSAISFAPDVGSTASARAAYAELPLAFVPNRGQHDARVRYSAQGSGFGFFFTKREAVFSFSKGKRGHALALRFVGASPAARLEGTHGLPGRVNYFLGRPRSQWQTDLPTFGELRYESLWPGIDLVLRGDGKQLKYEFHLAPGARASDIRLAYAGARSISLAPSGALRIKTRLGTLIDMAPRSYQVAGGTRTPVTSRYVLHGSRGYGFALGPGYDAARPLIIDPGLVYSTFLGGTGADLAWDVDLDAVGNAYVSGTTDSVDFPTTPGAYDLTFNGPGPNPSGSDAFVSKLNPSGSALVYSTYLGGSGFDRSFSLEVGAGGSAYLTGRSDSPDFPTTLGAYDETPNGSVDVYVTKLNATGSSLVYSTLLGGFASELGTGLTVDVVGNAYVTGSTGSPNYPTTPGAYDQTFNGPPFVGPSGDPFVTKLNPAGSALVYSTFLGGTSTEFQSSDITTDASGNAYVTGQTSSPDFPTTPGAYDQTYNGGATDTYVTKLSSAGSALIYSTFLGGLSDELSGKIAVDGSGHTYLAGGTGSPDFPTTPGAHDQTYNGGTLDAFAARLNPAGSALAYSTLVGGAADEFATALALHGGNLVFTGATGSPDYPTTPGAYDVTFNGVFDVVVTELNSAGSTLRSSTFLGGTLDDTPLGLALDPGGNAHIAGSTSSADYPTTQGAYDRIYGGGPSDGFVTKLDLGACPQDDDEDDDGLTDSNELRLFTLLGHPDSDLDGVRDGNDDANGDGEDDEDEDDDDECPDEDGDDDGEDDEDEDDDEDD